MTVWLNRTAETIVHAETIRDGRCAAYPTGVSPRQAIPTSCNSFSYCNNGVLIYDTCPAGQYFDKTIGKMVLLFLIVLNLSQLGNCYDINSLPCGSHCGPACSTPETINFINDVDSECTNHPTGLSHRVPILIDGVQSCNSFGFCRNGQYYTDDCTPGQYFDENHGKSTCNTCS